MERSPWLARSWMGMPCWGSFRTVPYCVTPAAECATFRPSRCVSSRLNPRRASSRVRTSVTWRSLPARLQAPFSLLILTRKTRSPGSPSIMCSPSSNMRISSPSTAPGSTRTCTVSRLIIHFRLGHLSHTCC